MASPWPWARWRCSGYAQPQGEACALTLAFTAFVLFQFFDLFNACSEHGTAFNHQFFRNRWP